MKQMYWVPRKVSLASVLFVAALAVGALALVESLKTHEQQAWLQEKQAAARWAENAMSLIRAERLRRGYPIEPHHDPAESGMIGLRMSPMTSIGGHLGAKQTSVNPNFAAAVLGMLRQSGVGEGDLVAVGYSGSYPMLNLSVCAALETLKAKPVIIASAGASQFGANMPDFLWVDIERFLHEQGLLSFRSVAASYGGYEDRAVGMSEDAREMIREGIARNNLPQLESRSFPEAIEERMAIYRRHAQGGMFKAYVNVGGGTISVGRALGKKLYRPGLNLEPPPGAIEIDSVMTRFAKQGVPLIHLVEARQLAAQFGFPEAPEATPPVGEGNVYVRVYYNRTLAAAVLLLVFIGLFAAAYTRRRPPAAAPAEETPQPALVGETVGA